MTSQPGQKNTMWQATVRKKLLEGWGVDDIAVQLNCDASYVRAEVDILRKDGDLRKVLGVP